MFLRRHAFFVLVISLLAATSIHAQVENRPVDSPKSAQAYEDSGDGLEHLLQDVLAAAKTGDRSMLKSYVEQMEVRNYETWFTKTFGEEMGRSWAGTYSSGIKADEKDLEDLFRSLATENIEFTTRKVNQRPDPAREAETVLVEHLQRPVDIFYAGWRLRGAAPDSPDNTIGYFMFDEGKFRWGSTISLLEIHYPSSPGSAPPKDASPRETISDSNSPSKSEGPYHPGVGGVGFPSCEYCPDPQYPKRARAENAEGTVVLQAIIQADGSITGIQTVKSPRVDLTEEAIATVRKWRFKPAMGPAGKPVAVIVPIELIFRLQN